MSAVLVVVAFITLIIGIFQDGLGLIWASIASSVLAAIFLLLGVVRSRPSKVATAGAPAPGSWGDAAPAFEEPLVETAPSWVDEPDQTIVLDAPVEEPEEIAPPPPRRTAAPRPSTSRATGSRAAASRSGAAASRPTRTPATQMPVVVIPDRDKFHKETCRYAKTAGAMTLTKSEARREGYKPCGVCKP